MRSYSAVRWTWRFCKTAFLWTYNHALIIMPGLVSPLHHQLQRGRRVLLTPDPPSPLYAAACPPPVPVPPAAPNELGSHQTKY
mgnify:CR=1 FL=1